VGDPRERAALGRAAFAAGGWLEQLTSVPAAGITGAATA
jgi:hypothetical protein